MKNTAIFLFAAIFLFGGCRQERAQKETVKTVKVTTAVRYGDEKTASFPGRIRAASEINVSFRISGPIVGIHAGEGQFVRKGQILAEMDSRDYIIQLAATEAEYRQIKAEAERIRQLFELQNIAENDYDRAMSALKQITAKYERHKNALDDTKLTAPFDGYIQKRFYDAGETIDAGMSVFSMISAVSPEAHINIPAAVYIKRDRFDAYSCHFELFPDVAYSLELISINQKANLNQLHTVRFRLGKNDGLPALPIGSTIMVTIHFKQENTEMVSIPTTALFEIDGKPTVWVYDENVGNVNARHIALYEIRTDGTVVVSEGVKSGEHVVSAGVQALSDGEKVRLLPQVSPTNVGGVL